MADWGSTRSDTLQTTTDTANPQSNPTLYTWSPDEHERGGSGWNYLTHTCTPPTAASRPVNQSHQERQANSSHSHPKKRSPSDREANRQGWNDPYGFDLFAKPLTPNFFKLSPLGSDAQETVHLAKVDTIAARLFPWMNPAPHGVRRDDPRVRGHRSR